MKPEITAATEFLSRIFLAHNNITKEKVLEFRQHLSELLEERFRDHWHESCPTKGQAYRCIRVCPEEPLDPLIEKVCAEVGINAADFNPPFELTLWVDPTEVVCKFGDLKCSYHTVAKKDQTSGNLNNHSDNLDIDDLVENARELYLKKQTVVIHPVHSTELHIQNSSPDGAYSSVTMAIRINGTVHYNVHFAPSGSPPVGFDASPSGKGRHSHMTHKRAGGYNYYGKGTGGKANYIGSDSANGGTHVPAVTQNYHHHHQQQQQHNGHHLYQGSNEPSLGHSYSNGYLNSYSGEDNGYGFDPQMSVSPPKVNIGIGMMTLSVGNGTGQVIQGPPTPEQIQQQVQHPPPMPTSIPPLQHTFSPPSTDSTTQPSPPSSSSSSTPTATTITTTSVSSTAMTNRSVKSSAVNNSKYQNNRGGIGSRNKQTSSPGKEAK